MISQSDGFALAMLVILLMSFGMVALLILGIYRSSKRRAGEVDELIEELRREEAAAEMPAARPSAGEPPPREPWEKEADWWKS